MTYTTKQSGPTSKTLDLLSALAFALAFLLVFPAQAHAYVDPSVMTYTIQALAGVAVALSAALGVLFRRTRRKVFALLHIDEDSNKAKDPAVQELDCRSAGYDSEIVKAQHAARSLVIEASGKAEKPLSRKAKFIYALFASVFFSFTLFFVAPTEIVAASISSLIFTLWDVWWVCALFAAIVAVVLTIVLCLLKRKAFDITLSVVFSIGLACWIQAMFLNTGLPAADGRAVNWMGFAGIGLVSLVVWVALIALPLVFSRSHRTAWRNVIVAGSLALVIVQGVGVASLFTNAEKENIYPTEQGLYQVASDENVIVFILDTYDSSEINTILDEEPDFFEPLTGFTYYRNMTGSTIPTAYAVPYLLTNQLPEVGESWNHYLGRRYSSSTLLDDISNAGYSIGIYTDSLGMDFSSPEDKRIADETLNIHSIGDAAIDIPGAMTLLEKAACYRDMPWIAKPAFWFWTDQVNNQVIGSSAENDPSVRLYHMDDGGFHSTLETRGGLDFDETSDKAFRFIHLDGAHYPYILDENGYNVESSTPEAQQHGSMRIVYDYIAHLKELGVYDNATIIITADHGVYHLTEELNYASAPMLFVKPAQTAKEASQPLQVSDMPISHMDVPATIASAVGADSSAYGSTVYEANDPDRVRYYYQTFSDGVHVTDMREIQISPGDPLDLSNWEYTGTTWTIPWR